MSDETEMVRSCRVVILAAGKGTRMNSDLPKVVLPLGGQPMVRHVLEALQAAGFESTTLVVGYREELVREATQDFPGLTVDYVTQKEQLGTGHAVLVTEGSLAEHRGPLLVTNGDMPLIRPATFRRLVAEHKSKEQAATVLSCMAEEPFGYGRLVRDSAGRLERIVEERDADEAIKQIKEINTGTYVFDAPEVFSILRRVGTDNDQGEYYLPDTLALLRADGRNVGSVVVADATEAMGANSPADLEKLEEIRRVRA